MNTEFEKLKAIIADVLNLDPEEVTMESTFADDLGADSLDLFEIMNGISDEFDITIPQEEAEKVTTVGEAFKLIQGALGEKA
ncbi:MAG: acyl carrier protein [Lachnospiraceae bacterium]|nr:acyl carrier protein [Lachnospiraceae bacterium]MBQ6364508.1 acyl carrier protein [Lachnospiraceae bacterium]